MHMDGQSAIWRFLCRFIELLEKLRIKHTDNEVQRTVVFWNESENSRFLHAHAGKIHLIGLAQCPHRGNIELLQMGD